MGGRKTNQSTPRPGLDPEVEYKDEGAPESGHKTEVGGDRDHIQQWIAYARP